MADDTRTIVTEYAMIGCVHDAGRRMPTMCKHFLPSTTTETAETDGNGKRYIWRKIEPHCARISECAARRQEIYDRAEDISEAVMQRHRNGEIGLDYAMRRRAIVWETVTSEYKHQPCPFFEPA